MQRRARRVMRWLTRHVRLALFLTLALAVFSGTARAGTSYFFCSVMGEARQEPCCQHHAEPVATVEAATCPCCQSMLVKALPASVLGVPPVIASSPLVALQSPPVELVARAKGSPPLEWPLSPRAGPTSHPDPIHTRVFLL